MRIVSEDNRIVHDVDPAQLDRPPLRFLQMPRKGIYYTADEQMVVYTPLKTAPWHMVGFAPVSDFVQATDKLLVVTLGVVVAVLVAILLGYYIAFHRPPLNQMCRLMEEGEQGI